MNSLKADVFKIVENITLTSAGKIEIDFKPQKSVDVYVKMVLKLMSGGSVLGS